MSLCALDFYVGTDAFLPPPPLPTPSSPPVRLSVLFAGSSIAAMCV